MSFADKAREVKGRAKEKAGDATDNERLEAGGATDRTAAARQAGEHVKDAGRDVRDAFKG